MASEGTCTSCGGPLDREKWNSDRDILVCDNYQCTLFRRPLSIKEDKDTKDKREKAIKKASPKLPEWLGGPSGQKEDSVTARLQRLRHQVYTEDEEAEVP